MHLGENTNILWGMAKLQTPEEQFLANVGDALRVDGLSVEGVAKQIEIAPSTLRYQLARPGTITLRTACKLRDSLGVVL